MADTKSGLHCPECSAGVVKCGTVRVNRAGDRKQQWLCKKCGRRTLNPIK